VKVIRAIIGLLVLLTVSTLTCFAQSDELVSTTATPQTVAELLKVGWAQLDASNLEGALVTANKVLAMDPKSGNGAILHFLVLNRKDPHGDPTVDCNRIIELAPSAEWVQTAYIARGDYRLLVGDYDAAIDDFSHSLAIDPNGFHAYEFRSFAYLLKGDLINTRSDYEKSLSVDPASASPFVVRAYWQRDRGSFSAALADYDNAIQWKPDYAEAFIGRGVVLGLMGNIEECLKSFKRGLALNPDAASDKIQNGIGRSMSWDMNSFVKFHPSNARGYEMRGLFRLAQHKDAEATQDFEKSLQLEPALKAEIDIVRKTFAQP
jgi:tetratricopeptide (TPR) repeat protein